MLEQFKLRLEVEELIHAYVECIDDDRLEEWPEFFTEDNPVYKIIARENFDLALPIAIIYCNSKGMMADRIVSLRQANVYAPHRYRHLVSNIRVHGEQDGVIRAQSNYAVLQTLNNGETTIYSAGRYQDILRREGGALRFQEKLCIYDTTRIQTLLVTPL